MMSVGQYVVSGDKLESCKVGGISFGTWVIINEGQRGKGVEDL